MTGIVQVAAPPLVDWPRAEAAHENLPWEIWWVTTDLRGNDRRLSAHLMLVHLGGGRMTVTATIADLDREHEHTRRLSIEPGDIQLPTDRLDIRTELGSFSGSFTEGYRLRGRIDDHNGFDIALTPTAPVLHASAAGQFTLGTVVTTQYSVPRLEATGTITESDDTFAVNGHGWHDRQWIHGGTLADTGGAFTWFGLCLDNGHNISLWDTSMRPGGGRRWVTIAHPDGTHVVTAAEPVLAIPGETVTTIRGAVVPRRWRLAIPSTHAELEVTQQLVQDAPHFFFYTGALEITGTYDNASVHGHGFCDLVAWTA